MDPMTMMMLAQQGMNMFGVSGEDFLTGGGLVGGYIKSKRRKKKLQRKIERQRKIQQRIQETGLKQQEGLTRLATQQQVGGLENAERAAQVAGRRSIQNAQEQGAALQGRAAQSLASRGLGSTTVAQNAQRAIGTDISRSIAGINEGLGQQLGALATQKGALQAGGTQQLAELAGERANFGIQQAGFWMPKYLEQLGFGNGQSQGGGFDPQMLQWIFGAGGEGG